MLDLCLGLWPVTARHGEKPFVSLVSPSSIVVQADIKVSFAARDSSPNASEATSCTHTAKTVYFPMQTRNISSTQIMCDVNQLALRLPGISSYALKFTVI